MPNASNPANARWTIAPASADASFRRYFRVTFTPPAPIDAPSIIVMDAPPAHEDCRPFILVAELFRAAGVNVPRILAQDLAQGFLALDDLGDTTYLQALELARNEADGGKATTNRLYRDAIDALVAIQRASKPGVVPDYDRALLERELRLFPQWYVQRQLGRTLTEPESAVLEKTFEVVLDNNLAQPSVFVHRDYHSRNLMRREAPARNPGVIDFQDAVYGPITYDLVSLLRDAYIVWPEAKVIDWAIRYWEAARRANLPVADDFGAFYRDFEWMGVQRQIKVVGIFARLAHRDGKLQYLSDQPLVLNYLRAACQRYSALGPFARLLETLAGGTVKPGYTF
ncbi:MAG: phosphotransferase [Vicinamibacterales bacterium]